MGLKALQSYMTDSYHKSALYWHTIAQSLYVKGTMGGIRYGRNQPFTLLDVPLNELFCPKVSRSAS